ncbi:MAG: 2-iminoacetate synthase ThiH [Fibrobacter sp.]|nr:2-iminoacetate synthase ThiH [Fibrobacter sp.]
MPFTGIISKYDSFDFDSYCDGVTSQKVKNILSRKQISEMDFLALLSPAASQHLEEMAQRAMELTRGHFGNAVVIFTPLYISNYCRNTCPYCSFAAQHHINRRHLSVDEVEKEAENIARTGIRHILVLTGESKEKASVEYLESAVRVLRKWFSTISIEVYPLQEQEYGKVIEVGVDGLTIYQETYNIPLYKELHKGGPKSNYEFRLLAPERACRQGIRQVTVGALLGLYNWRSESFFTALHAAYLQKQFPSVEVSVSFPRLRPLAGDFQVKYPVNDRQFVQIMTATRIFLNSAGITISTRESENFRNSVLPLGITKVSAGTSTAVGGHSGNPSTTQFEIADSRDVSRMRTDLMRMGFQPVMHDWNRKYLEGESCKS